MVGPSWPGLRHCAAAAAGLHMQAGTARLHPPFPSFPPGEGGVTSSPTHASSTLGHAAKNSVPRPQSGQAGVALKLSEGHVRPQSKSF